SLKADKFLYLFGSEPDSIFLIKVPSRIQFTEYIGNMDAQRQYIEAHVVAYPGKVINAPDVTVFAAGQTYERRLFIEKTIRELARVHKRLQNTRKAPVVFGNHKDKFLCGQYTFLIGFEAFAAGFVHICRDKVAREISQ